MKGWLGKLDMPKEIILHATLDEKRHQLQQYRSLLYDILSHQQDVLELQGMASSLSEGAEDAAKYVDSLSEKHGSALTKAKDFVEQVNTIAMLTINQKLRVKLSGFKIMFTV